MSANETTSKPPVTVLTGFLDSAKTTLLNRILTESHGRSAHDGAPPRAREPDHTVRDMSRRVAIALAFTLGLVMSSAHAEASDEGARAKASSCPGELDLHVFDEWLHEPIANALVTLDGDFVGSTDARGGLEVAGICQHRGTLKIAAQGYGSHQRQVVITPTTALEVRLEPIFDTVVIETAPAETTDTRATAVLTGERLEAKRGQPLSEAIADVPGVAQLRSGSGMAKPIVRGQFGRRLPILVDGVRHRSQDWGIDHAPELDPFVADRITIVRGASGVRHGSDAVGGALLVDPPEMPRRPGTRGEAHVIGSNNGLGGAFMGRVQTVPEALPGLALQLEGSAKRLRAVTTPDYPLDNTAMAEWSAGATASYRTGDHVYKLSYRHYEADLGVCICFRMESSSDFLAQLRRARPIDAQLYRADWQIDRPYQAVAHDLVLGRARWSLPKLGKLTTSYAFQMDDRREFDIVRSDTTAAQFAFSLVTHDADVLFEHNPVHLGEHLHLSGGIGAVGMIQSHAYGGLPLVPDHEAGAVGVHATERLWGHSYEIEAGVRYDALARTASLVRRDFLRLVRDEQLAEDACGSADEVIDPVKCDSVFRTLSASLGGLWRPRAGWSLKLDLSTAARPPNPDEQYLNGTAPSFPVYARGDASLRAETTYGSSLTAVYEGERVNGELSVFGNYVSDYIYFAPVTGPDGAPVFDVIIRGAFPRFSTRAVDATFHGADGYVSASPRRWLRLDLQGAIVRGRNLTDDTYLVFVPPDRARASMTIAPADLHASAWLVSLGATYVRRQNRFDPAADLAPPPDAYALADASVMLKTRWAGHNVRVALQGTNLFGSRYREYASLLRYFVDQPGRQITLRVSFDFDTNDKEHL